MIENGSDKAETLKRRNLHDNFSSRIPRFVIGSSHPVALGQRNKM